MMKNKNGTISILISDVNECATQRPCQHDCVNTHGSYTCQCYSCYTKVGSRCDLRQCKISNTCYAYGTVNPSNPCQVSYLIPHVIITTAMSLWRSEISNNYTPKWRRRAVDIYRAFSRLGKYPSLFTDTEVNNCVTKPVNSQRYLVKTRLER